MRKIFVGKPIAELLKAYHNETGCSALSDDGKEYPSSKKLFVSGDIRPETMQEQVRRMMRVEFDKHAKAQGFDTIDEANDFEMGDEPEFGRGFEVMEDEIILPKEDMDKKNINKDLKAEPEPVKQPEKAEEGDHEEKPTKVVKKE